MYNLLEGTPKEGLKCSTAHIGIQSVTTDGMTLTAQLCADSLVSPVAGQSA